MSWSLLSRIFLCKSTFTVHCRCWACLDRLHPCSVHAVLWLCMCVLKTRAELSWPALPLALIEIEAVQMKYIQLRVFSHAHTHTHTQLQANAPPNWWWMTKSRREGKRWREKKHVKERQSEGVGSISVTLSKWLSLVNPDALSLSKPSAPVLYPHHS